MSVKKQGEKNSCQHLFNSFLLRHGNTGHKGGLRTMVRPRGPWDPHPELTMAGPGMGAMPVVQPGHTDSGMVQG